MPCDHTKEFLSSEGVQFQIRNIRTDPAALQELLDMGARATPVVRIGDETVVGFDLDRLRELLRRAS